MFLGLLRRKVNAFCQSRNFALRFLANFFSSPNVAYGEFHRKDTYLFVVNFCFADHFPATILEDSRAGGVVYNFLHSVGVVDVGSHASIRQRFARSQQCHFPHGRVGCDSECAGIAIGRVKTIYGVAKVERAVGADEYSFCIGPAEENRAHR